MQINIIRKIKNIIEINNKISHAFDRAASSSVYKKVIYWKIKKYTENIVNTKKYNVIIETTNFCNAKCIMCPQHIMKRKKSFMSDETFFKLIFRLKNENIKPIVFILNGFGEPLTDIKIFERIKELKVNFPNSKLKFYTNLGLANDKIIDKIIDSGIDEINISFNGFTKESYEEIMKVDFEKTKDNIEKLVVKRNKNHINLKIRISMALVSENEYTVKKFLKEWENKVDSVSVNKIHTYGGSVNNFSVKNRINFDKLTYPCKYLWNTIVIGVEGDLFICCLDYEGNYNFGNINQSKILDIFYSDEFRGIRKIHLKNHIKKIKLCSNCYTPYKNGTEWLVKNLY